MIPGHTLCFIPIHFQATGLGRKTNKEQQKPGDRGMGAGLERSIQDYGNPKGRPVFPGWFSAGGQHLDETIPIAAQLDANHGNRPHLWQGRSAGHILNALTLIGYSLAIDLTIFAKFPWGWQR